jgi:anti-sigma B factor antagonist
MEAGPDFTVTRWRARAAVVVVPEGEIDLATVEELEGELEAAAAESAHLVLDLRAVDFIDSAGIRLVLETHRALQAAGGELAVVRGPGAVQRVFELVGLGDRVPLLDHPPE